MFACSLAKRDFESHIPKCLRQWNVEMLSDEKKQKLKIFWELDTRCTEPTSRVDLTYLKLFTSPLTVTCGCGTLNCGDDTFSYPVPKAAHISERYLECIWEQFPWPVNSRRQFKPSPFGNFLKHLTLLPSRNPEKKQKSYLAGFYPLPSIWNTIHFFPIHYKFHIVQKFSARRGGGSSVPGVLSKFPYN